MTTTTQDIMFAWFWMIASLLNMDKFSLAFLPLIGAIFETSISWTVKGGLTAYEDETVNENTSTDCKYDGQLCSVTDGLPTLKIRKRA